MHKMLKVIEKAKSEKSKKPTKRRKTQRSTTPEIKEYEKEDPTNNIVELEDNYIIVALRKQI